MGAQRPEGSTHRIRMDGSSRLKADGGASRVTDSSVPIAAGGGKWKRPFPAHPGKREAAIRYAPVIVSPNVHCMR